MSIDILGLFTELFIHNDNIIHCIAPIRNLLWIFKIIDKVLLISV